MVESLQHTPQVPDAVTVAVGERPRIDLVDRAALPPPGHGGIMAAAAAGTLPERSTRFGGERPIRVT
jgi:hypothetical protein